MRIIYALFAMVALAGLSFAPIIVDPYLDAKFEGTLCYAEFADSLVSYTQDLYYANGEPEPAYLQQMRDDLGYEFEGGALEQLYTYVMDGDRTAFNSQYRTTMGIVYQMKASFRTEARNGIMNGWFSVAPYPSLRSEVMDVYQNELENLQECLGGEGEPT